ncbi:MAG TPA: hypothetical protein VGB59_03280 [Allosphingosinicella sp.]|jgi:hypothetical protein
MNAFRLALALGWVTIAGVTAWALATMGVAEGIRTFFADFRHPWRAQFYSDLEATLALFALWIAWRERWRPRGFAFALATMLLGALFILPYVLAVSLAARGDVRVTLLGQG